MEENKKQENVEKKPLEKPTYEQLNNWCNQLMQQRNEAYKEIQNLTSAYQILPYLFEVVKARDVFSEKFVAQCINNIENLLSLDDTENKEEK